jgi:tRNA-dihydrouridine synthase A
MDLRFCVAPMMDWTDRHCRAFHRVLSRRARLYTEMVTTGAVLHGDRERLLGFDAAEHPVAVQLGGSDPRDLAASARICADLGYDEVNLNVGCPSDRVQNGAFGACLMREPALVGDCVAAMKAAVAVPVTVKCRLGVDEQCLEALDHLADAVLAAGADALIVHARKAWLKGLSPRENRDVPPLDYEAVYALKRRVPHVPIALNGGLTGFDQIATALGRLDGVMVGRAAYGDPALLLEVDARIYGETAAAPTRLEALEAYLPYIAARLEEGAPLHAMTRHMLGLFNTWPGARAWRRHLSVEGVKRGAGLDVVRDAAAEVRAPEALVAA